MMLMMSRPLLMARLLDTHGFAFYSAGLLVSSTFCMLGCLGMQPLLQREMPVHFVRGRERAAALQLLQCLFVALACAFVGLLLAVSGVRLAGLGSQIFSISVLHGLSQQVFLLATTESRSRGQPLRFAQQSLFRATLVLSGAAISAALFDSAGKTLLTEALISGVISWRIFQQAWCQLSIPLRGLIALAVSRLLLVPWKSAFALLAVMITGFGLLNLDRWLAASFLSVSEFAHYAFAWIVLMVAQSAQVIINASIYPMLARRFAKYGRVGSFSLAWRASGMLLIGGVILIWPALWLAQILIARWFPTYLTSLALLQILVVVAVIRLSDFWTSHLIIVGQETRLLLMQLCVAILVCGVWLTFVRPWDGGIPSFDLAILALSIASANYVAVSTLAFAYRR